MATGSPAIDGANYSAASTHPMALPTGTGFAATVFPVRTSWVVTSSTDGYLAIGGSGVVAAVPSTRAPGAAMPAINGQVFLPAGVPIVFDVPSNSGYVSGIAVSLAGTVVFTGPITR